MSTYKGLYGFRVEVVSSNPSNPLEGEVWYNSTLGQLKGYVAGAAAFTSGGALPTGTNGLAAAGTTNSSILAWGGKTPPGSPTNASLLYNGTSWTATPNLGSAIS